MNVGDYHTIPLAGGNLIIARIATDEFQIKFVRFTWLQKDGYLDFVSDLEPDLPIPFIITCPGDDVRILLMQVVWEIFGIQLGYHQVEGLCDP